VKLNSCFQFSFLLDSFFVVVIFVPIIFLLFFTRSVRSLSFRKTVPLQSKKRNKKIWLQNSEMVTVTGRSWNISIDTGAKVREDGGISVYFLKGQFFFLFAKASNLALGSTLLPISWLDSI